MNSLKNIDNIIFDLGGVVIDLKRENAVEALQRLGLKDADDMLGLYVQKEPFLDLETGRVTVARFFDFLRNKMHDEITDLQIQEAFNAFLISIPRERLLMLRRLREAGLKIYVLSNTNPVMYHSWIEDHFRQEGLTIRDYFDGIVTSFEEGRCKPDVELFKVPLRRYRLDPLRTIMLDDSEANCNAAREAGMRSARVDNTSQSDNMIALSEKILAAR